MLIHKDALVLATFFQPLLEPFCEPGFCRLAGGVRRGKAWVHDLELVVQPLPQRPPLQFGVKPKDAPRTLLDVKLKELEKQEYVFFQSGDQKNKKFWINLETFNLPADKEFTLDLWITTPPAQYGVNLVLRTGPNTDNNQFSKWVVTPRAKGGALPDGYRVKHAAVWRVHQMRDDGIPYEGESPLAMPSEDDFLDFLGVTAEPAERRADWGRWTR